jgi:uncharacterized protein YhfF
MTNNNPAIKAFWQAYLDSLPPGPQPSSSTCEAWYFGDNEGMANELGHLVKNGIKMATCSMLWEYEAEQEPIPQVGELSITIDWAGRPLCLIETTEVEIKPFNEVDAQFAYDEGEGDRSLAYWRRAHQAFFTRVGRAINREFRDDMPVVCERFHVIFRAESAPTLPNET